MAAAAEMMMIQFQYFFSVNKETVAAVAVDLAGFGESVMMMMVRLLSLLLMDEVAEKASEQRHNLDHLHRHPTIQKLYLPPDVVVVVVVVGVRFLFLLLLLRLLLRRLLRLLLHYLRGTQYSMVWHHQQSRQMVKTLLFPRHHALHSHIRT